MDEVASGRIFLSYRRVDTSATAGRVYDRLESRFGAENVFMDVDSIFPGHDFAEAIYTAVGSSDALLVLIGKDWLTAADTNGRYRLDDPDDFVALEIEAGLDRGIPIIPVLVDGASPPRRADLPEPLQSLARRQALRLNHESFTSDINRLITALERILTDPRPALRNSARLIAMTESFDEQHGGHLPAQVLSGYSADSPKGATAGPNEEESETESLAVLLLALLVIIPAMAAAPWLLQIWLGYSWWGILVGIALSIAVALGAIGISMKIRDR